MVMNTLRLHDRHGTRSQLAVRQAIRHVLVTEKAKALAGGCSVQEARQWAVQRVTASLIKGHNKQPFDDPDAKEMRRLGVL